jgi:hypothetical protein
MCFSGRKSTTPCTKGDSDGIVQTADASFQPCGRSYEYCLVAFDQPHPSQLERLLIPELPKLHFQTSPTLGREHSEVPRSILQILPKEFLFGPEGLNLAVPN